MFDARKAIICFQYVERIKSELIIAAKLLGEIGELKGNEVAGARKVMSSLLDALHAETRMAQNVLGLRDFEEAALKLTEAAEKMRTEEYSEAIKRIAEAISHVTTSGQKAMQTLKEKGLL